MRAFLIPRNVLKHVRHSRLQSLIAVGILFLTVITASGCAEFEFLRLSKQELPGEATAKTPAAECLCIWQPAEGKGVNGVPTRGFAGQVMFFTHASNSPVAVNGKVRIYVFDNLGTPEEQAKPIHQFDFEPAVWNAHLHRGMLGPTYHVFVPYTRSGSHGAACSLQVRYTPEYGGSPLFSEKASVMLPGKFQTVEEEPSLKLQSAETREQLTNKPANQLKTGIRTLSLRSANKHPVKDSSKLQVRELNPSDVSVSTNDASNMEQQPTSPIQHISFEQIEFDPVIRNDVGQRPSPSPARTNRRFKLSSQVQSRATHQVMATDVSGFDTPLTETHPLLR
ncbi:hypothetical protein [Calycomorphotria hydatis]|uniref:Uncharacterized protein n=1 Tax=Calycomorphotria hydatis TaxID=2528027 RepID=A0A517T5H4_9PLAN|nr:hypothetical protein [Calycomorphotria hydatis]QDT63633.1 hypothetical protein V22_08570 [Calycomorphotria hydatis]